MDYTKTAPTPDTFETRLASFDSTWKHSGVLHPLYMAAAGFTYDPDPEHPDAVICKQCNEDPFGWDPTTDADPIQEHFRIAPHCPYVKQHYTPPAPQAPPQPPQEQQQPSICRRCKQAFPSKNKLHAHVRETRHFSGNGKS